MSAVWGFFELNEVDCQLCKDKASLAELSETDCTAQPWEMKRRRASAYSCQAGGDSN